MRTEIKESAMAGDSMPLNPARIAYARSLERITQKRLAALTGMSQGKLSKLQNGFIPFVEHDALAIARALDYPLSFFMMQDAPHALTELTYRKRSTSNAGELSAVAAEYSSLSRTVELLQSILGMTVNVQWMEAIAPRDVSVLNRADIDRIANRARGEMRIGPEGAIPNVTRALERMGIVVAPLHSAVSTCGAKTDSEGVCRPSSSQPCIGYADGERMPGDRLRFTKAHELGHLLLHRYRRPSTPQQVEREANLFAGAFLLPEQDVRATIHARSTLHDFLALKTGWGTSVAASIRRAYELGIMDQPRYKSLQIQLSSRGWRIEEPGFVGAERPVLFKQMMEACFASNDDHTPLDVPIKSMEATSVLGMPFRYLDRWAGGLTASGTDMGIQERRFELQGV